MDLPLNILQPCPLTLRLYKQSVVPGCEQLLQVADDATAPRGSAIKSILPFLMECGIPPRS
jgi:hypothetical protein